MPRWLTVILIASATAAASVAAVYLASGLPAAYPGTDAPTASPQLPQPLPSRSFALVLGSGGPRGFAHVGVIKALTNAGLQPSLIVGTSAGALVGALYAAGLSAPQLEQRLYDFNLMRFECLTISRYGFLRTDCIARYVNEALEGRSIEALSTPLAVVATRVPQGELRAFTRGNAGIAVAASAAIPNDFVPVVLGNDVYVDGDLVSPVAVTVARQLGASIVVAVDISADLASAPPMSELAMDWVVKDAYRRTIIERELAMADIVVRPKLPYYAGTDRSYREMAVAQGVVAGEQMVRELRALMVRP